MRIFIFGANGMLGTYVSSYFRSNVMNDVIDITRKDIDLSNISNLKLLDDMFKPRDVVINCAGVIKQRNNADTIDFVVVNSVLPHYLNTACMNVGAKLIHVTTDCVFSGVNGSYDEDSIHDAIDVYGWTKSLGEPKDATVIRTSIIGEELNNLCSLIEWVKSNKDKEVLGYTNHLWNGITCLQFAKICELMIDNNSFWKGIRHITSPSAINKYDLIELISKIYDLNITVKPFSTEVTCDRTLSSTRNTFVMNIPELEIQLKEQKEFLRSN